MMERLQCEFALVRYVPDPVKGEFTNIGVVLRAAAAPMATVRFTRHWNRVRCLDPEVDTEMLESLEAELNERLSTDLVAQTSEQERSILDVLSGSLSNSVQITDMRGTLAESLPAEMEQLLRVYVEPLKMTASTRKVSGRGAIAGQVRDAFTRAGVWSLMRKRVAANRYTQNGDPLKLDCGYRNGKVRLFHAVSLEQDTELAKSLAYSIGGLREGVARLENSDLELTAIVEPVSKVSDAEQYSFGLGVMESAGLRVLTVADLGRVAEAARRDLRV